MIQRSRPMANKRMFSSSIIDSDAFIEMSPMARLLYINLSMHADDDGFTNSTKREMRIIGASDSDLDELVEKRFVIRFDSGVVAIKHWRINNTLRSDRYKETTYTEEKNQLIIEPNGAYTMKNDEKIVGKPNGNQMETNGIPSDNQCVPQYRGGEDRIDKDRLGKVRLGEGCACACDELPENQADSLTSPSQESNPILYFPTKNGNQPIYQSDIDNLTRYYNGAIDVKAEILACAENSRSKPESVSSWQTAVTVWISRTLRFKETDNVATEGRRNKGSRRNRSMEPDKYIEAEDAGL